MKNKLIILSLLFCVSCATVDFNTKTKHGTVVAADLKSAKKTIVSTCYPLFAKIDSIKTEEQLTVDFHCVSSVFKEPGVF